MALVSSWRDVRPWAVPLRPLRSQDALKCFIAEIAEEGETAMRRSVRRGLLAFAAAASIGLLTMASTAADAATPAGLAVAAHRDAPVCQTSGLDIWAATNPGSAYAGAVTTAST